MPYNIRGKRYPVGTWRVCQQCREFYTEAQPCPCRRTGHEVPLVSEKIRPRIVRAMSGLLGALKRGWFHAH